MSQDARLDPQLTEVLATSQGAAATPPAATTGLLGRLSVGQKLALAGLLVAVPFAVSLGSLVTQQNREVSRLEGQLSGHRLLAPLQTTMYNTQLMRLTSAQLLQGEQQASQPLETQRQAVTQALASLQSQAKAQGFTGVSEEVRKVQQALDALSFSVDAMAMTPEEAQSAYGAILKNSIRPLFDAVASASGLRVNTDNNVGEMLSTITTSLPDNVPVAGAITASAAPILAQLGKAGASIDATSRQAMRQQWELSKDALTTILSQLERLATNTTVGRAELKQAADTLTRTSNAVFDGLQDGVITPTRLSLTAAQLGELTPAYDASLFDAYTLATKLAGQELQARASAARQRSTLLTLAALLGLALLGTLLYLISRAITQPLSRLTEASQRLSRGELDLNVPVTTRDEVGQLATSFNVAAAQLRENAARVEQERIEAQQLQQHVGQFLDVTMDIAEGDLTKRGKVTNDVLGNVVDSINVMVEELGETLRGVQTASSSVTGGSRAMLSSTAQIEQGASVTTEEALRVARQAQEVNVSIQEMARLAQRSADTARQALIASQEGQQAVSSTLEGMQNIRGSSEAVSSGVQTLSERSEQIQEIVDSISHIASQTNLLSLHASIEAAGAGEAGTRFAVVAEEVRQLADESNAAAGRIAALISQVQAEIRELSAAMSVGAQNVEQGFQVAQQAGEKLRQIGSLSQESAQLAQTMSQSAGEQVRGVENMGQGVQQIAQIAEASQESVKEGRSAAEELQKLAQQLNQSLTRFRLPS
ncbi:methyl-accepting chemotaxis protein [Deinococcus fonticola]|uniref:methyl-accepting chemotaxis protein n=1 Tax=Deinococcus fonticola TaxID=2528713 RepID=UPI0010757260|nr:methyl-accepting chemotaxis protein [Deinococcus fonticola]